MKNAVLYKVFTVYKVLAHTLSNGINFIHHFTKFLVILIFFIVFLFIISLISVLFTISFLLLALSLNVSS